MRLPLLNHHLSTTTMPKACVQTEHQLQDAIVAYKHAQNPKISDIAREFHVDYQCLRQRLKGVPSRFQKNTSQLYPQ
ncbi:uncharacterized protein ASPGLDRAFT_954472 [Aspergillus glaucus CBS 516.65]|uniref:Uncharacterized protein n=1 Tax=Aspergillus glaucus CBS 516.65 TaxID=1160497 RepID=A0A1L9V6W5_ASPGL|nr:hypothetical protein ASPGLDRAFT_954472 [Aspergillus glaucus CBS 516.65]OJJ79660.1 hypothetical protein ASPGLDRAFT_954472 [Aspergillus glaucus CBS 516.65]